MIENPVADIGFAEEPGLESPDSPMVQRLHGHTLSRPQLRTPHRHDVHPGAARIPVNMQRRTLRLSLISMSSTFSVLPSRHRSSPDQRGDVAGEQHSTTPHTHDTAKKELRSY